MLFASVQFIFIFLPIQIILYFLLRGSSAKNWSLLIGSLVFYFWGETWDIFILGFSVITSYFFGCRIDDTENLHWKRIFLGLGLALNLGILFYFKYVAFVITVLSSILTTLGLNASNIHFQQHLPLGISFFVFHAASYLIDTYRAEIKAEKNLKTLALYFFLFPHQIAGPIVRFKQFSKDRDSRQFNLDNFVAGIERFVIGLAKKTLVANTVAVAADSIFALTAKDLSAPLAWLGAICYGVQIFFDFSGYSDMAIGLARIFGFHFHENFNFPYSASSITEFWRRWHISLSTWFRDYLYIPLGGNKRSKLRTYCNLTIVFLLCGLWHGASLTFVVWGLWHGLFLVIERLGLKKFIDSNIVVGHVLTLIVVLVGWVIFRSETLEQASIFLNAMFSCQLIAGDSVYYFSLIFTPLVWCGIIVGILFSSEKVALGVRRAGTKLLAIPYYVSLIVIFFLSITQIVENSFNPFIYFRF